MRTLLLSIFMIGTGLLYGQRSYKEMMYDPSVNFYDVVKAAEAYFETHDKGQGSGWKGYQRWKAANEPRYYPSGDRSQVDPYFTAKAYRAFQRQQLPTESVFDKGWRDLGPYDANNITSHYSPGIGRVESFWVNPNNDQQIYLGSRSGGFWRSLDGGNSWQNTTDTLVASGVNTITVDPQNPNSVLINIQNAFNNASHGLYRSMDGGITWLESNFNPTNLGWGGLGSATRVYEIAYHPTIPNLVFIATSIGLFRSDDDLNTWTQIMQNDAILEIDFHPTNPNVVYIYNFGSFNQNDVKISNDQGISFSASALLSGNSNARCYVDTSPDCPDCIYVGSSNGIWKSTNMGGNFTFLYPPQQSCWGFAVSDLDDSHIVYGGVDLEASTNGGTGFSQVTSWFINGSPDQTYVHADLRVAKSINGVFYIGTDGYLAKSTNNGFSWSRISDGTGIRENYAVGVSQSNWELHMCGSQDNGTSIKNENGWIEWNGGDGMEAVIQPLNDNWMMGSWQYGIRNITKDAGLSRQGAGNPESGSDFADWEAPLLLDPNQQMRIYHFADNIFRSDEFGEEWEIAGSPNLGMIQAAAIAYNNSDFIAISRGGALLLSDDAAENWRNIGFGLPNYFITDIEFAPNHDSTIAVTFSRYQNDNRKIYISHDLGTTWENITYNLGNMPLYSVAIDHTPEEYIYAGAEIGVYYKAMDDTTWKPYNQNFPTVSVRNLEVQFGANLLKAATWGRGLWDNALVGRKDYPSILMTNITDGPTELTPTPDQDQTVTSLISYDGNLSSAFVKWSINEPIFDKTIPMVNTADSTWQTQTPIPSDLPNNSTVFFKVFAVGDHNDTTETYKYTYRVRGYCTSFGNQDFFTAITKVEMGGLEKYSGKVEGYDDYTQTDSIIMQKEETYQLSVTLTTNNPSQYMLARAWIDWNQNWSFDIPNEEYYLGFVNNSPPGQLSSASPLAIAVPPNAPLGKTMMRVMVANDEVPEPCLTDFDGEVEDYSIIVERCKPDTELDANSFSITVSEPNAVYQWIDCKTDTAITGAVDQVFIPTKNGTYAVIVNANGCIDTSDCFVMETVGIYDHYFSAQVKIYPNPNQGKLTVDLGNIYEGVSVEILDLRGKVISRQAASNERTIDLTLDQPAGVYLLKLVVDDGKQGFFRIIKE